MEVFSQFEHKHTSGGDERLRSSEVKLATKEAKIGSMYESAPRWAAHATSQRPWVRGGMAVAELRIGPEDLANLSVDFLKPGGRRRPADSPDSALGSWHRGSLERELVFR